MGQPQVPGQPVPTLIVKTLFLVSNLKILLGRSMLGSVNPADLFRCCSAFQMHLGCESAAAADVLAWNIREQPAAVRITSGSFHASAFWTNITPSLIAASPKGDRNDLWEVHSMCIYDCFLKCMGLKMPNALEEVFGFFLIIAWLCITVVIFFPHTSHKTALTVLKQH